MSDTEEPAADVEVSLSDTEPADDGGGGDLEAAMGLADEGDEAEAEPEPEPEPEPGNYSLLFFSLFFFPSLFPSLLGLIVRTSFISVGSDVFIFAQCSTMPSLFLAALSIAA